MSNTSLLLKSKTRERDQNKPTKKLSTVSKIFTTAAVLAVGISSLSIIPSEANADPRCLNNDPYFGYCVGGKILEEYNQTGGFPFFGNATIGESSDARGGRFQAFKTSDPNPNVGANSIYWNPNISGGHANQVGGAIRDKWAANGWETGPLGYPTTRELPTRGPGRLNRFEGGNIYYSQANGTHPVWGAILSKWGENPAAGLDYEMGRLGFPSSDEFTTKNNGRGQHFAGGELYWSSATGAHPVWGDIRQQWINSGWENGAFGYPISDELEGGNANTATGQGFVGKCQMFQGGPITWNVNQLADKASSSVFLTTDSRNSLLLKSNTKYSAEYARAVTTWNNKGKVNIRPANPQQPGETPFELTVADVNRSDVTWLGHYTKNFSIHLNVRTMEVPGNNTNTYQNVITHEIGHALGFSHSCDGNIMLARASNRLTLGPIDDSSYAKLWG